MQIIKRSQEKTKIPLLFDRDLFLEIEKSGARAFTKKAKLLNRWARVSVPSLSVTELEQKILKS